MAWLPIGVMRRKREYTGTGRDVKKLLHDKTRCSRFKTIILDSEYNYVGKLMAEYILQEFRKIHPRQQPKEKKQCKDCDDGVRRFWNFAKDYLCDKEDLNGTIGMTQLGSHAYVIFADTYWTVYSLDLNTDVIQEIRSRPKWIMM